MRRYKLGNLATYLFISGDDGSVTHMTLHVPPRSSSSIALSAVSPSLWPLRQILPANPIDDDDDVPCPFPPLNYHESEAREGGSSSTHPAAVVAQKRAQRLQREDFFTPRPTAPSRITVVRLTRKCRQWLRTFMRRRRAGCKEGRAEF